MMLDSQPESLESTIRELQTILAPGRRDLRTLLYRELLTNALDATRYNLDILDLKLLSRAVAEFRYAARIFQPYRGMRKVSIFGSARTPVGDPYYNLAVDFTRKLAEEKFMVITGAAEGIMRAGIEGAGASNSFGVNILLPFESTPTSLIQEDPKLVTFRYFFIRKIFFVMEANAFAVFPGGFGTHDEVFEVLTLVQTGKARPTPIVLMELPNERYWETWDRFIRQEFLDRGYISPEDLSLYKVVHSPEEGVEWIKFFYSTYHSMRQVRDVLVIRMEREISDEQLAELNEQFIDLIQAGVIMRTPPLPMERDEPELLSKPRIAFAYNQKSAGRLTQLIIRLNEMGASGEGSAH
jgi:uncharacterized protein (TIGR00730 family)